MQLTFFKWTFHGFKPSASEQPHLPQFSRSIFAACDKRSHICDDEERRNRQTTDVPTTTLEPTKRSFRNSIKSSFDKIKEIAGNVVLKNPFSSGDDDDDDVTTTTEVATQQLPINFTEIFESAKNGDLSHIGIHFTFFEFSSNCQVGLLLVSETGASTFIRTTVVRNDDKSINSD